MNLIKMNKNKLANQKTIHGRKQFISTIYIYIYNIGMGTYIKLHTIIFNFVLVIIYGNKMRHYRIKTFYLRPFVKI